MHCASEITAGKFATAQALLDEADAITEAAGSAPLDDAVLLLAGWRGVEEPALERMGTAIADAAERGEESTITAAEYAAAVLYNGLGRHDDALGAAQRACDHHPAKAYAKALVEMVEAAAQLSEGTSLSGTDWALGIEARSRALLSAADAASPPRRPTSHGSRATGSPTPRSPPGCSSARAPSSTTCTRCSASSTSARATSSSACCPVRRPRRPWRRHPEQGTGPRAAKPGP